MSNEAIGFLIVFSCLGFVMFVGGLATWPERRFNVLKVALKCICFGLLLVGGYAAYAVSITGASLWEVLALQTDPGEVKRLVGLRSVFPAHLLGYVFIAGGVFYLPFAFWLRTTGDNS